MNPEQFIDAVAEAVDLHLANGMRELNTELAKVIATKKLGEVSEGRLEETCQLIYQKAKEKFDRNMEKFRIYAMRNIFAPSSIDTSTVQNSSSAGSQSVTDQQLIALRQQYLALQAEWRAVEDSRRDTEVLLKDMRSALFTLRVGAQVFDAVDIHNIAETVSEITHNKATLEAMCAEASAIIANLTEYHTPSGASQGNGQQTTDSAAPEMGAAAIETKDAEDIAALTKSLKRK